jgi:hypothetical protein
MSISTPVVNPKLVTVSNPLRGSRGVDQETEMINQRYSAVLDHLLTPPQVKEQLMKTLTLDKKKQMCEMYKQVFEQGGQKNSKGDSHHQTPSAASGWGERENALMSTILKAKTPDLQSLSKLKIMLSSANREFMTSFLESGGVSSLLKMVDQRLLKRPFTELDIAVLYEVLSCFKAVMNNPIGMDGIANSPGSIDILTRCLRFDYKLFSIQVFSSFHSNYFTTHDIVPFFIGAGNFIRLLFLLRGNRKECSSWHAATSQILSRSTFCIDCKCNCGTRY